VAHHIEHHGQQHSRDIKSIFSSKSNVARSAHPVDQARWSIHQCFLLSNSSMAVLGDCWTDGSGSSSDTSTRTTPRKRYAAAGIDVRGEARRVGDIRPRLVVLPGRNRVSLAGDFIGRLSGNNDDEMDFGEMAEVPGFGPNDDNDGIGRFLFATLIHQRQLPPSR
jgi:hypothetical protein